MHSGKADTGSMLSHCMPYFPQTKPCLQPDSGFAYDEQAYVSALDAFASKIGLLGKPFNVLTHGFVLGQYGLLWALRHRQDIQHLAILSTPLGQNTSLRPELAAYKAAVPFMRPKPHAKFAGDLFNASGQAYVMRYDDAQVRILDVSAGAWG